MYLCRKLTDTSYVNIGKLLGKKDHTTIIHGVNKIEDELKNNDELASKVETSSCLLGPGYEKTPLTKFLVRGVKFTRYHPASAHCHQGALMASNKAAAGNVAVTARPTAWGSDGRLRAQAKGGYSI